jgi:hypothetical protein
MRQDRTGRYTIASPGHRPRTWQNVIGWRLTGNTADLLRRRQPWVDYLRSDDDLGANHA